MATYKKPCIHCGELIDGDSRFCVRCGSHSPFSDVCPSCLRDIDRGWSACPGCGRPLYIVCPRCGKRTFVQSKCEACGGELMIQCRNKRCMEWQFFENATCTACGKKLKAKLK